ncbi:MAG TPA: tetratricopeptide repeat protein [Pyrinomonadaceae bacterium]|jgi:tetratricopeptide (TPR) repeat protein
MLAQSLSTRKIIRFAACALGLLVCVWGIWNAGRAGLSRRLSKYALGTASTREPLLSPADEAVRLTPADPDAHFNRAVVLGKLGRTPEALAEFERAAALRPRDYYLWMLLGTSRDQTDDEAGALAALTEAVRMAPFYAKPRWQFGNVLFRAGRLEEGFAEMRRAALSDQKFLPNLIDLAWNASGKGPAATTQLLQPESKQWRMMLARFLARRGRTPEALNLYRAAGALSEEERRTFTGELLTAKGYAEAYEVWASGEASVKDQARRGGTGQITNGSFEQQLSFDETGFGWKFLRAPNVVQISLDTTEPRSDAHSLRLDWNGNPPPNAPFVSQLVLVEPNARYRLSFSARTQEIVSGALPLFIVEERNGSDVSPRLAQSKALPKGSSNWQDYSLEFATSAETRAVLIGLLRESCSSDSCPIFGRLWLDDFSIQKL